MTLSSSEYRREIEEMAETVKADADYQWEEFSKLGTHTGEDYDQLLNEMVLEAVNEHKFVQDPAYHGLVALTSWQSFRVVDGDFLGRAMLEGWKPVYLVYRLAEHLMISDVHEAIKHLEE